MGRGATVEVPRGVCSPSVLQYYRAVVFVCCLALLIFFGGNRLGRTASIAKLITKHDPFHIHKILGVLVLLHYAYRFVLLFRLSWSSLLLPLPSKRNFSEPMIWPEFRLHSIVFATRHIVTSILSFIPRQANFFQKEQKTHGTIADVCRITTCRGSLETRTTETRTTESGSPQKKVWYVWLKPRSGTIKWRMRHGPKLGFGSRKICLLP